MTSDPLPLQSLLCDWDTAPSSAETNESLAEVRDEIRKQVPGVGWTKASKQIDNKILAILNQPVDQLLVEAWAKTQGLQKYTDAEAYPPDKTVLTSLLEHKLEKRFKPSVVLQVAGTDAFKLELPISLSLQLEGVVLRIAGGQVRALQAGSLQGVGSVKFMLHMLGTPFPPRPFHAPVEKKTDRYDFPAEIDYEPGIRIQPREQQSPTPGSSG